MVARSGGGSTPRPGAYVTACSGRPSHGRPRTRNTGTSRRTGVPCWTDGLTRCAGFGDMRSDRNKAEHAHGRVADEDDVVAWARGPAYRTSEGLPIWQSVMMPREGKRAGLRTFGWCSMEQRRRSRWVPSPTLEDVRCWSALRVSLAGRVRVLARVSNRCVRVAKAPTGGRARGPFLTSATPLPLRASERGVSHREARA